MSEAANIRLPRGALLTLHNAKTPKAEALGVLTAICYLAPYNLSGHNVCAKSTPDCRRDCLFTSGRGRFKTTRDARLARTDLFWNDRAAFMRRLHYELAMLELHAGRLDMRLAVRLNGTSDILWERAAPQLFASFPRVSFYDYTKHAPAKRHALPANYRLCFSAQRETMREAADARRIGWNVAAVTDRATHAALIQEPGFIDGAAHDARHLDAPGSIVLLTPKGSLEKHDARSSGMILTPGELIALQWAGAHNAAA